MGNLNKNLTFLGFHTSGIPPRKLFPYEVDIWCHLDVELQGKKQLVLRKNTNDNPQKACFYWVLQIISN